ncbi:MAG: hypothetical protein M3405_01140 [Acidobacteriota bacterium]|nr:hypothetical protein [Acidobacteriota bacterium]
MGQWSDQVHHFAFAFSGGINNAWWGTAYHNRGDRKEGNYGDVRLTNAAYSIGLKLRVGASAYKSNDALSKIGQTIKDKICEK